MPCSHLPEFKSKYGVESYKTIYEVFICGNSIIDNKKIWVRCFRCSEEVGRLLACLHCVYIGCFKNHTNAHHHQHGHKLYVELSNGCIFCVVCKDYAYDRDFELLIRQKCSKIANGFSLNKWRPSEFEEGILQKHKSFIKILPPTKGIRGMINLGKTCYMNCIMQALLHTPMLRDYFFADKHECQVPKSSECIVCLLAVLFQKYYSDEQSALILHEILYFMWQKASHFSGYEERDAHEFFIAALNLLHQYSVPKNVNSSDPCTCIIDVIFQGKVQSDLVCQSCSNISTRVEPIMDISLDIPDPSTPANLYQCLNNFMTTEILASKINCSSCNSYQKVTKQLTLNTLSLVIVIQLKRLEFTELGKKKKNTYVSFPLELDMSSYMARNRTNSSTQDPSVNNQISSDSQYILYAVIEHRGAIDAGHYVAYIKKSRNSWYECSDGLVVEVDVETVMGCEGYLLFYHKTVLNYS